MVKGFIKRTGISAVAFMLTFIFTCLSPFWIFGSRSGAVLEVNAETAVSLKNSSALGDYIEVPKTGQNLLDISDKSKGFSFRVFDDGGYYSNYSTGCSGSLVIRVKSGYVLEITGNTKLADNNDILLILDGESDSSPNLYSVGKTTQINDPVVSSGNAIKVLFVSNNSGVAAGFDLTMKLYEKAEKHSVTLYSVTNGKLTANYASAKYGDTVSVTATPNSGYALKGVSVADSQGRRVKVTGGTWEHNTATFKMPLTAASVSAEFTNDMTAPGGISLNIPATGNETFNIPSNIKTFKVYDDGGPNGNYSDSCNGSLTLKAPSGYRMQIFGTYTTEEVADSLYIYNGATMSNSTLKGIYYSDVSNQTTDLSLMTSTSDTVTFKFESDGSINYSGIELTVVVFNTSTYNRINCTQGQHGSFTCDKTTAKSGETVTLTATPDSGYILNRFIVTTEAGMKLTLNGGSWYNGNTATFSMAVIPVSVTAEFVLPSQISINIPATGTMTSELTTSQTSFKVFDDGGENGSYSKNCNGTLVLNAPSGYAIEFSGSVRGELNKDVLKIYDGTTSSGTLIYDSYSGSNGNDTSIGPIISSGRQLSIQFRSDQENNYAGVALNVKLVSTTKYWTVYENDTTHGIYYTDRSSARCNDKVIVTASPNNGYYLGNVSVTDSTGRKLKVFGGTWDNPTFHFFMPSSDATIDVQFTNTLTAEKGLSKTIPYTGNNTITVPAQIKSFNVYDDGGKYAPYSYDCNGVLTLNAPSGYRFQVTGTVKAEGGSKDYLSIIDGNETSDTTLGSKAKYGIFGSVDNIGTVVSSSNVITLKFVSDSKCRFDGVELVVTLLNNSSHSITCSAVGKGTVTADKTTANENDRVNLTVTPQTGYQIKSVTVNNVAVTPVSGAYYFSMPSGDASVVAEFEAKRHTITYKVDGSVYKTVTGVAYGSSVTAIASPTKTGYSFSGWSGVPSTMPDKDVTVTGSFTINNYTITFNTDGGSTVAAITQNYGTTVTAPANPTKTGYTFAGWDKTIPSTMPAQNMTIKAKWTVKQYTITFNTDGGSTVAAITQNYGTAVTAPANPTKTGYTFAGWDKTIPSTMPAQNMTIKAKWTIKQYTITFNTDGGSTVASITQDYGTAVTAPANPTKTGYTFAGWDKTIPSTMPAQNMTIKAKWTIKQYTITFNTDGGSTVAAITQNYGTAVTAPANPTKTGYTFAGWDKTIPSTMPAQNMTIKAKWTVKQYTITFNTNGGSTVAAITQNYGTAVTAPANPTRTGYTFAGWDKTIPSTMPAQNMTITASWTVNKHTITYKVDGSVYKTVSDVAYGTKITAIAEPTKEGYTFSGWSGVPATMPDRNVTITGTFSSGKYTITFDTDGGSTVAAITQDAGTAVTAPANPTKTGYTFAGWDKTIPSTMPAQNMTITASWTVNKHTITYKVDGSVYKTVSDVAYGTKITAIAEPTKEGYTFSGWSGVPATMPDRNVTITGTFSSGKYTITFNTNGGSTVAAITQDYGTAVTAPANPTRTGYTFAGWDKTIPSTMPAQNMTITASWTVNKHTITYKVDGSVYKTISDVAYGTKITAIAEPTKEGYTFSGWSGVPATMPDRNVTITGTFSSGKYTITFNTNGGSTIAAIIQDAGTAVTAPANPTRTGYTFTGWDKTIPSTMPAQNMTITASWTVNKHTITYKVDGSVYKTISDVAYGTKITAIAEPTKEGYTFSGWSGVPATMPDRNVTITGTFSSGKYTITFNTNGGSTVAAITQEAGTAVTAPANPTKTGYTFAGWDKTIPSTMPAQNMTITASWTVNKHTITYKVDGSVYKTISDVAYGTKITAIAEPTKEGYTFSGWSGVPATMPDRNVTITGTFSSGKYTITFNTNGGSTVAAITQEAGTAVTAPTNPTRTGYTFTGWDKTIPSTMPAQNITITATWKVRQFTITFSTDGGSDVAAITQDYGTVIIRPADPKKQNFIFCGWDKAIPSRMPGYNMTIKAVWRDKPFTITFDTAGGSKIAPISQEIGTAITAPADPTRTGYTFNGWDKAIPAKMPAEDLTITASWKINRYTITFDTTGGSSIAAITQNYGSAVTAPADPTRTGYTFNGWDQQIPSTMPAGNMTIKAKWYVNNYTITFDSDFGTVIPKIVQSYGSLITKPEDPTRRGYTFIGWDKTIPTRMPAKNMTIKARWKINQYTITFNSAGGSKVAAITQDYDTAVKAPAAPTRTGYSFIGWDKTIPSTMPAENLTIKATWAVRRYTITFDSAGGTSVYSITQNYGAQITPPKDPTRSGYTFAGWEPALTKYMHAENVTVKAKWNPIKYTITFDTAGGSRVAAITQDYNTAVKAPADPTRTGYSFNGWDKVIPSKMPAANVTITAKWKINRYTITFDSAGGTAVAPITQDYATKITPPKSPTKTGYTFAGWEPKLTGYMHAENVTLKAKWKINQYTITFDSAGGTAVAPITQNYATKITPPKNPTRTGYTFAGWEPKLTGYMHAENVTLKAKWKVRQYTITFDSAGGTAVAPITQDYATKITPPKNPTRTGYTFAGWEPKLTGYMHAKNVTVKAKWKINQYTITFDSAGGTAVAPITQNYATKITPPKNPTRTGYTFAGWEPKLTGYMHAENVTLKAKWKIRQYTITFDTAGGSAIAPIKQNYATLITPPKDPTRKGYTFAGWDKTIPKRMQAKNITIKAKWKIKQYTITFDTAGGSAIASIKQNYNSLITKPKNPTRVGYTFAGWSVTIPERMPAKNMTIKAKWKIRQYTITFDTAGGSAIAPIKQNYKTVITPPKNPTKKGYTFAGWSVAIPKKMPAKNMVIKAKWKPV